MATEKEKVQKEIEEFVRQADEALGKAQKLALEHKVNFYFDPGGHGMYFGSPESGEDEYGEEYNEYGITGWESSHC